VEGEHSFEGFSPMSVVLMFLSAFMVAEHDSTNGDLISRKIQKLVCCSWM
jgi:hypothetical protein